MSHIQYTICRSGTYYYNRRMPKHAVSAYGQFIRKALSNCSEEADAYSKRLSDVLEASWKFGNEISNPIDISAVLNSFHSRSLRLSEVAQARR